MKNKLFYLIVVLTYVFKIKQKHENEPWKTVGNKGVSVKSGRQF